MLESLLEKDLKRTIEDCKNHNPTDTAKDKIKEQYKGYQQIYNTYLRLDDIEQDKKTCYDKNDNIITYSNYEALLLDCIMHNLNEAYMHIIGKAVFSSYFELRLKNTSKELFTNKNAENAFKTKMTREHQYIDVYPQVELIIK